MKKSKVTRSLLAACSIVALTAVMYGCTHSGDDGVPQTEHDQAVSDLAELRGQINALRAQLGLEEDDDPSASIDELQDEVDSLKKQIADRDKADADAKAKAEAKARKEMAAKLYAGLGSASTSLDAATISIGTTGLSADTDGDGSTVAPVIIKRTETPVVRYGAWRGTDYLRVPSPALIDHAVIYSNQDEPESELFAI